MITPEDVVEEIWHFYVEDGCGLDFCTSFFNTQNDENLSEEEVENLFNQYFLSLVGIKPFIKCPACGEGITIPKESQNQYYLGKKFIGCSRFPECRFMATDTKPFKSNE